MQQHEYDEMVNKNTLRCWSIIIVVLIAAYILEIAKGLRSVEYVVVFLIIGLIPLLLAIATYVKNPSSATIKQEFAFGYCIFYTYVVLTTQSPVAFVYILPMVSIILAYCNRALIFFTFGWATVINVAYVLYMGFDGSFIGVTDMADAVTFWEIQIACLLLTGVFLYLTTNLLIKHNAVIEDIIDDVYEDALTGLKNVRFLDANENSILCPEKNEYFGIAFIDIDDFKQFNTKHGHSFGDTVLQALGHVLLKHTARYKHTYAVRNGGDEFLIISRILQDDAFVQLVQDVCDEIASLELSYKNKKHISITISAGVSTKNQDGCESFKALYDIADSRNQCAKDAGKNAVISKG